MTLVWQDIYVRLGITPQDVNFHQRVVPVMPRDNSRLEFIMGMIAYHSQHLEDAGWDRWELHRNALLDAYELGTQRKPITMYHFLKWHKAILPFGGSLRECNPVSRGMGESFRPEPVSTLPARINQFVANWTARVLAEPTFATLAHLHFTQWSTHPYGDGNKRHCRLMTIYGCGLIGAYPVCITLADKTTYINALDAADEDCLADLFHNRQVQF